MMKHLTRAERDVLTAYIRARAIDMGLSDWDIDLDHDVPDMDDALALCTPIYGRRAATISVYAGFRSDPPEKQRAIIIHELLHCHFELCSQIVREDARSTSMRREEADLLDATYTRAFEEGIDGAATAWARTFPLIRWSPGDAKKTATKKPATKKAPK
jgi:hypothetical protein